MLSSCSFSLEDAQRFTDILCGCAVALSSAEYLVVRRRLANDELLSWQVGRSHAKWSQSTAKASVLVNFLFDYQSFRVVLLLRLIASLAMILSACLNMLTPIPVCLALFCTFLIGARSAFGLDGAHQMNIVILSGLFVSLVSPSGSIAEKAGIWFVAAQSGLSYLVAGTSKLSSTAWRDGTALIGIFSTDIYGCQPVYKLLVHHPAISRIAAWSVMTFESAFVGLCLLGPRYALVTITLGVLFHLGTAVSMGLNTFLASFVAAYPAVWFVVTQHR